MMATIFEEYEFPRSPGDQMDPTGPVTDGVAFDIENEFPSLLCLENWA